MRHGAGGWATVPDSPARSLPALRRFAIAVLFVTTMSAVVLGFTSTNPAHPEPESPQELAAAEARSDFGMVSTGSPEATRAAVDILERGGNAVDAAVAAAMMLSVADTDSSGIGGMTYMVIHRPDGRDVAIDGTPPAPAAVVSEELLELQRADLLFGHKTVAVPTTVAVLELARSRYGTMAIAELVRPAIEAADQGYLLSPIQITWTHRYMDQLLASRFLRFVAMEDGQTVGLPGDRLCRPALAATLRRLAVHGAADFYRGGIADAIERDMINHGGFLRKSDLMTLRVREREPLRTDYRGFDVLTFPAPGGGCRVTGALNLLARFPSSLLAHDSVERLAVLLEAYRIANGGDAVLAAARPGAVVPLDGCIDPSEAAGLAPLIVPGNPLPKSLLEANRDPRCSRFGETTTQISIVDQHGMTVSLTQSLGRSYGAAVMAPDLGFPYNDLLVTFDFANPECSNYLLPRRRVPTPMAPTIVLHEGRLVAALGSGGSNRIPSIISLTISNLVDRGMDLHAAVVAPRVLWGGTTEQEPRVLIEIAPPMDNSDADRLLAFGYPTVDRVTFPASPLELARMGSVNAVGYDSDRGEFIGVGDPRRSGVAEGPRVIAAPSGGRR